MEIKRIKILCVSIGLLILISCKLYEHKKRDKREEVEIDWQHTELRQRLYTFRQDTLSRRWYFWTDSSYRFHPDSGFIGQQGKLVMLESKVTTRLKSGLSSQASERNVQTELRSSRDKRSTWTIPNLWLITFIGATVLLLGWRFRKFFKTFLP
ncbi:MULTISPECIES: hypothetical protein [Sphingobacterium]|nr:MULTISPECIES: hypothetical protein [Sphingobacterium]